MINILVTVVTILGLLVVLMEYIRLTEKVRELEQQVDYLQRENKLRQAAKGE